MFVTQSEIKTLLRIDNTNYDSFITAMIPLLIEAITEDCNNHFTTRVEYEGTGISFVESGKTINDDADGFEDFKTGFEIYISGSLYNDGHQILSAAADGILTATADFKAFVDEDAGETVKINRVIFPPRLKLIISNMIQWQIKKFANFEKYDANDKSFSVTIDDYPQSIRNALSSYMILELF